MNQFPEKLMKLRKHYRISQQQVASFCHVELVEYMGWENGRSLPDEHQIELLAELFHLSTAELKSASLDMPLQEVKEEAMEEIEFPEMKKEEVSELDRTQIMRRISEVKEANESKEQSEGWIEKLKSWKVWALAVCILAVVLVFASLFKEPENTLDGIAVNNRIMESERLASGKDFILVLNSDGTVSGRGSNDQGQLDVASWSDIAAISCGDAFSVGLKKDGTVVASGSSRYGQTKTEDLTDIIEISAGAEHLAALKADGTVICLGDNSEGQCEVSEWTEIVSVSAAKSSTLGLKADGSIVYAGKMDVDTDDFTAWTKVKKLYNGQTQVLALSENSTVYCTASSGYNVCQSTENWTDVISIKTAGNHAAALHANGRISASGDNSDGQINVEQFKNILSIAAGPDYLVTLNRQLELIGVGNNASHQFDELERIENTPLPMVSDITILIDSQVMIHWNEVSGADYYTISIPEIGYSANVADLNAILPLDRFINEAVYTVGITALTMDNSRTQSQEAIAVFTFFAPESTPEPIPSVIPSQAPDQGVIVPTPTPEPEETVVPTPEVTPTPEPAETPDENEEAEPSVEPSEHPEDNQEDTNENEDKSE